MLINLKKMPAGSVACPNTDATWPAQYSGKPDYRYKYVILNWVK